MATNKVKSSKTSNSKDKIDINPDNVLIANDKLDRTCDSIKKSYNKVRDLKDELLKVWKGNAPKKYDKMFDELSNSYKKRFKPVKNEYIPTIEEMVKGYIETDDENSTIGKGFVKI